MPKFLFGKKAAKVFRKLPKHVQERITLKLLSAKAHPDIYAILVSIIDMEPATHRLRIGKYRLILQDMNNETEPTFLIVKLGQRKDIYN